MENELKFIFQQVVLHKFGIEFNQLFTGDVFNKLRQRKRVVADVLIPIEMENFICLLSKNMLS